MDAVIHRLLHPTWHPRPQDWVWTRPDGQLQGPGLANWRENPGMFNLSLLALDMERPPRTYDARNNSFLLGVMTFAPQTRLGDMTLDEAAGMTTLPLFLRWLEEKPMTGALAPQKELFKLLAQRRLDHAHA